MKKRKSEVHQRSRWQLNKRINATIISLLMFLLIVGCTKTEYIDVDVAPQLELTVVDVDGNPMSGANATLYLTEEELSQKQNPVKTLSTDASGKILFEELTEAVYYFYIVKDALNNQFEVMTFSLPLKVNEIKSITCIIR